MSRDQCCRIGAATGLPTWNTLRWTELWPGRVGTGPKGCLRVTGYAAAHASRSVCSPLGYNMYFSAYYPGVPSMFCMQSLQG